MREHLSNINSSGRFVIYNMCSRSSFYPRLIGQGLHIGREIEIIAVNSEKYILKVDNSKLTLDKSIAENIIVERCNGSCFFAKLKTKFQKKRKHRHCHSNYGEEKDFKCETVKHSKKRKHFFKEHIDGSKNLNI